MSTAEHSLPLPHRLPLTRWAGLLALLVGELLVLTVRFDTVGLEAVSGWWAEALRHSSEVPRLAAVIASAVVLFGGSRLRRGWEQVADRQAVLPTWPFLVAHLILLALFSGVSTYVLDGDVRESAVPAVWAVAWVGLATATLASWAAVALPVNFWLPLARRASGALLVGGAVGVAAWGAGQLTDRLWPPLAASTFWVARGVLSLGTADVVCEPAQLVLGTPTFLVSIAPECSGYEGIGLVWVFLSAYLWLNRRELRFPAALVMVPAATVLIWLANALRIAALVALGTWGSREVALGGFHSQAGWLAFNAVALGTIAFTQRMFRTTARPTDSATTSDPLPWLLPLVTLTLTLMATAALTAGFDWLYPLRVAAVGAVVWHFRKQYQGLGWSWSWLAAGAGVLVFGLWLALEPAADPGAEAQFAASLGSVPPGWAVAWLLLRVVGSVVTAPLAEELAFRGYLSRRLIAADFGAVPLGRLTWFSFLVSSLAFGLLHGRWLAGTLSGMVFALLLRRRGRLANSVLAHAVANALIAASVLGAGRWSLWM
ncbi:MAG TPA: exosortase E/protease, VPEID-CTERM system [Gemmataceae bacterium]|nr:exosortase E/protease, VPEID-CTERM system [Gemmataceae bacterium]